MGRPPASRPAEAGEYLRERIAGRRRRRMRLGIGALAGCAAIPLAVPAVLAPAPVLVWNASPSAPIGLYLVRRGPLQRGGMAVARLAPQDRSLAVRRRYLPANIPLVKRVAALAGGRVCATGRLIAINGRIAAARRKVDPAGRLLPWWTGCRRLRPGEAFLLGQGPLSFDGRYFGISRKCAITGRAELWWAQ